MLFDVSRFLFCETKEWWSEQNLFSDDLSSSRLRFEKLSKASYQEFNWGQRHVLLDTLPNSNEFT